MLWSRITAILLVIGAIIWIASGVLTKKEAPPTNTKVAETKPFQVSVLPASVEPRSRKLTLSGRTEADVRTMAIARTSGVVTELTVRRGSVVKQGDVIAVLSDEARESNVQQAQARVEQRQKE